MRLRFKKYLSILVCVVLLAGSAGCIFEAGQAAILSYTAGTIGGGLFGLQFGTEIIVDRTCYENGVQVDCSEIPNL